jgi:hypothetical protein
MTERNLFFGDRVVVDSDRVIVEEPARISIGNIVTLRNVSHLFYKAKAGYETLKQKLRRNTVW